MKHAIYIYIYTIIIISIQLLDQFGQEPEPSQATGMALVRCIMGKFLGVVCHCIPPYICMYVYIYIHTYIYIHILIKIMHLIYTGSFVKLNNCNIVIFVI